MYRFSSKICIHAVVLRHPWLLRPKLCWHSFRPVASASLTAAFSPGLCKSTLAAVPIKHDRTCGRPRCVSNSLGEPSLPAETRSLICSSAALSAGARACETLDGPLPECFPGINWRTTPARWVEIPAACPPDAAPDAGWQNQGQAAAVSARAQPATVDRGASRPAAREDGFVLVADWVSVIDKETFDHESIIQSDLDTRHSPPRS